MHNIQSFKLSPYLEERSSGSPPKQASSDHVRTRILELNISQQVILLLFHPISRSAAWSSLLTLSSSHKQQGIQWNTWSLRWERNASRKIHIAFWYTGLTLLPLPAEEHSLRGTCTHETSTRLAQRRQRGLYLHFQQRPIIMLNNDR